MQFLNYYLRMFTVLWNPEKTQIFGRNIVLLAIIFFGERFRTECPWTACGMKKFFSKTSIMQFLKIGLLFYPQDEYLEGQVTIVLHVWHLVQHKMLITIEVMILLHVWQLVQHKILITSLENNVNIMGIMLRLGE